MPINSLPNSDPQLEDIFADSTTESRTLPLVQTVSYSEPTLRVSSSPRKKIWLIASVVICLLLLSGAGFGLFVWLKKVPQDNPTTTNQVVPSTNLNSNQSTVVDELPVTNNNTTTNDVFVDADHDGLSDQEEIVLNTNPKKKDTDEDNLSDREEVKVYLTDPRNPDTDGDRYTDGEEVAHFYDPTDSDSKKRLFEIPQNTN